MADANVARSGTFGGGIRWPVPNENLTIPRTHFEYGNVVEPGQRITIPPDGYRGARIRYAHVDVPTQDPAVVLLGLLSENPPSFWGEFTPFMIAEQCNSLPEHVGVQMRRLVRLRRAATPDRFVWCAPSIAPLWPALKARTRELIDAAGANIIPSIEALAERLDVTPQSAFTALWELTATDETVYQRYSNHFDPPAAEATAA